MTAPLTVSLLPRHLLSAAGDVDWQSVYQQLGIETAMHLGEALVAIVLLNPEVAALVHQVMLTLVEPEHDRRHLPVLQVPPLEEQAWHAAELGCVRCPGNTDARVPLEEYRGCGCLTRVERWSHCLVFRENACATEAGQ